MKYRILLATSGYYYVQKLETCLYGDYRKIGGFFPSIRAAEKFIRYDKRCGCPEPYNVVAYR
jgi:hypothetical protein